MDKKVYVWLFNNINRYEFCGEEANRIKAGISRMLITEDSINSEAILAKMQELYPRFCELFYNNVLGYQNGFADNQITATELDCYLIETSDGKVPIGYYRNVRPAEASSMVQRYLDQCKTDINAERNQLVVKWQNSIDSISSKYETIKNSKNPSVARTIFGIIFVVAVLILSLISIIKMKFIGVLLNWGNYEVMQEALSNIPIISYGNTISWVVYLIFIIVSVVIALLGVICIIKEIKLISAKKTTNSILADVLPYVNRLEQGVFDSTENLSASLYDAARKGENTKVIKNANSMLVMNVGRQIKTADDFTDRTEKQRTGISYVLIALLLVIVLLFTLSYSRIVADTINNIAQNISNQNPDGGSGDDQGNNHSSVTYPDVEKKTSTYSAYKSDATWEEANQYARNLGGYLVCINSEEEFYEVCKKAEEENIKVFWAGADKYSHEYWDNIKWNDGEKINFTQWLPGEPTYYDEEGYDENYLMVFNVKGTWYFNDATNDVSEHYSGRMGYIVEFEE